MNFRKLASWQEAESIIPVGGKCFLDPKGERWVTWGIPEDGYWTRASGGRIDSKAMEEYGATPYEATTEAVKISAAEAAARLADLLPVEFFREGVWRKVVGRSSWVACDTKDVHWRIPATQPEEDIYQIAVPKGTVLPDGAWLIFPDPTGMREISVTARVVKQEVKE